MSKFDQFILGGHIPASIPNYPPSTPIPIAAHPPRAVSMPIDSSSGEEESSECISLESIIEEKLPVKDVREFFRESLAQIKSEEENLFGKH